MQTIETLHAQRIGGEIPAFADRYSLTATEWRDGWLDFSNGRAALAFLLDKHPVQGALVCAYTCSSVPRFLERRGLRVAMFDIGASDAEIAVAAQSLDSPRLVLLPALFGAPPWVDAQWLENELDERDLVVIDAAQTAFGHADFQPSSRGAVFSCARKLTSLPDGAVLSLGPQLQARLEISTPLPTASEAFLFKQIARSLWSTRDPHYEGEALKFNRKSEEAWPETPHGMEVGTKIALERLDSVWHAEKRRRNHDLLCNELRGFVPMLPVEEGTPFSLPIFCSDRNALLARLAEDRIFATGLWTDSVCDPELHRVAAWFRNNLISLPVDQRHEEADMLRIAEAVRHYGPMGSCSMPGRRTSKPLTWFVPSSDSANR